MKTHSILGFALAVALAQNTTAQLVIPHTIPCVKITPSTIDTILSGLSAADCIEVDGETVNFKTDQNYSIRAGEYIQFDPNTVITSDGSHQFHAYIQREDMDLAWYYPNATPGTVGRYEKLEIGVQLKDSIQQKVENFVKGEAGDKLNPFDPDDIDLYAEFWVYKEVPFVGYAWLGPKRINGFYYEEFARNADTIHWDTLATEHNFRVRFAPPSTGLYRCKVTAIVAGHGVQNVSEFTFECVASSSPGFLRVGDNGRYLRRGNEPFFPVGVNLTGPSVEGEWTPGANKPVRVLGYYQFFDRMKELSESGGNSFRYIASPWQTEIEFEALGNYSNRMTNAWEFDNILDSAEAYGLVMHFNMQMHYVFERPGYYGHKWWDWPMTGDPLVEYDGTSCFPLEDTGYCYRRELDIMYPVDFFSDTTAMYYYKKKLRYMVARWGYSNDIGVMELLSEINNIGNETIFEYDTIPHNGCFRREDVLGITNQPYKDEDTREEVAEIISNWQNVMCRYIKEDSGHSEHPLSVSYAGQPSEYDDSYSSEFVDIATFNYYQALVRKYEENWTIVTGTYQGVLSDTAAIYKPMLHSEYGPGEGQESCDNNVNFIKMNTLAPFSGVAGAPYSWDAHYNTGGIWEYLKPINDLMQGIPLDEEFWFAVQPSVQSDLSVELFALRKGTLGEETKMVGVVSNRTYNFYTQATGSPCNIPTSEVFLNSVYQTPHNYVYSDLDPTLFEFTYMGSNKDYTVIWYNALTGSAIDTTYINTTLGGKGEIEFPGTLTGNSTSPILFFQLFPTGGTFLAPVKHTDELSVSPMAISKDQLKSNTEITDWTVYKSKSEIKIKTNPNPTDGFTNISLLGYSGSLSWNLYDQEGRLLNKKNETSSNFQLDLNVYQSGVYFLHILTEDGQLLTTKIVKQ